MSKIRVLIVDDHAVLRAGLRSLLNLEADIEVVGEAAQAQEALGKLALLGPDVVLMDIGLPGMDGLEATAAIKRDHPGVRVVILTMHEDRRFLYPALKAGATGYVAKRSADTELMAAIRAAHRGETFLNSSMTTILTQDYVDQTGSRKTLTEREREVLRLIAEGLTYKEMAKTLLVSAKTIEAYRERIKIKLGLTTRADLVRYALEKGLIGPRRPF